MIGSHSCSFTLRWETLGQWCLVHHTVGKVALESWIRDGLLHWRSQQILPLWKVSIVMAFCKKRYEHAHCVNQKNALPNLFQNTVSVLTNALVPWSGCLDYVERDTSGLPKSTRRWSWPPSRRPCSRPQTRSLSTDKLQQSQSANRKRQSTRWNRSGLENTSA